MQDQALAFHPHGGGGLGEQPVRLVQRARRTLLQIDGDDPVAIVEHVGSIHAAIVAAITARNDLAPADVDVVTNGLDIASVDRGELPCATLLRRGHGVPEAVSSATPVRGGAVPVSQQLDLKRDTIAFRQIFRAHHLFGN